MVCSINDPAWQGMPAHQLTGCEGATKHPTLGIFDSSPGPPKLLQDGATPTPGQRGSPIRIVARPIAN